MKGQTVHKYPMHQLLMVYHGDNGLEALSSSSPPNQDSCEKKFAHYFNFQSSFSSRISYCAASKSLVWKALISVKNRQTQSGSVRCSWEITLIYISPCFQCILVPAYQNIEFPHWGMAWEMPTPLPLQQSNSFQTFSRVSFSWAALVFKGTAFMPWWTQFLSGTSSLAEYLIRKPSRENVLF